MVVFRIVNIPVYVLFQQLWILLYCRRTVLVPSRLTAGSPPVPEMGQTGLSPVFVSEVVMANRNSRLNLSLGSQPRSSAFPAVAIDRFLQCASKRGEF